MTHTSKTFKILKISAVYDLLVTGVLIIPPLVPLVLSIIASIDVMLGFDTAFTPLDRTSVFFINLAAGAVTAWAAIRLLRPSVDALIIDIAFRAVLILCQIWAVIEGATPILLLISAVLAILALLELWALTKTGAAEASQNVSV